MTIIFSAQGGLFVSSTTPQNPAARNATPLVAKMSVSLCSVVCWNDLLDANRRRPRGDLPRQRYLCIVPQCGCTTMPDYLRLATASHCWTLPSHWQAAVGDWTCGEHDTRAAMRMACGPERTPSVCFRKRRRGAKSPSGVPARRRPSGSALTSVIEYRQSGFFALTLSDFKSG